MAKKKVLIDGDIIAYRAAFSAKGQSLEVALDKVDSIIDYILSETLGFPDQKDYIVYLTGSGNFRFEISDIYKAHRPSGEKPIHLPYIREYMINSYGAIVSEGEEADDLIAIEATRLGPDVAIVASVDKDMLQIPCTHFNFRKGTFTVVDEWEGTLSFYAQILSGDAVDNIIGLDGVGPVTARKYLRDCKNELDCWNVVLDKYDNNVKKVVENGRLLWLRREPNQIWNPPVKLDDSNE